MEDSLTAQRSGDERFSPVESNSGWMTAGTARNHRLSFPCWISHTMRTATCYSRISTCVKRCGRKCRTGLNHRSTGRLPSFAVKEQAYQQLQQSTANNPCAISCLAVADNALYPGHVVNGRINGYSWLHNSVRVLNGEHDEKDGISGHFYPPPCTVWMMIRLGRATACMRSMMLCSALGCTVWFRCFRIGI